MTELQRLVIQGDALDLLTKAGSFATLYQPWLAASSPAFKRSRCSCSNVIFSAPATRAAVSSR
eukprot:5733948-Prorocentrum_lima.AAC.1